MLTIFETILLIKNIPKDQLTESVKRTSRYILQKGGFFRNIHFLGLHNLPYRHSKNKMPFWEANYFYYEFNVTKLLLPDICNEFSRDRDVIKFTVISKKYDMNQHYDFENCTFEDEMKPVPYRPEVIKLVQLARNIKKNKERRKMKLNLSCDFYPFQR